MKYFILIVSFICCTSTFAAAQQTGLVDPNTPERPQDIGIYNQSRRLCSNFKSSDAFRLATVGGKEALTQLRILRVNSELQKLLDSYWFHVALDDCYPNDTASKLLFISALISADIAGKAVGGIGLVYIWRLVKSSLARLKSFSRFGYYSVQVAMYVPLVWGIVQNFLKARKEREERRRMDPALAETMEKYEQGSITRDQIGAEYVENVSVEFEKAYEGLNLLLAEEILNKELELREQLRLAKTQEERQRVQKALHDLNDLKTRIYNAS